MGWTVELNRRDRRAFLAARAAPWTNTHSGCSGVCLKSMYRGAPHKGVQYLLWEVTYKDGRKIRFVGVNLVRLRNGFGWAYKDMDHSMHPYNYSCPLSWLEGLDAESGDARAWISNVREYWKARREKRAPVYRTSDDEVLNVGT